MKYFSMVFSQRIFTLLSAFLIFLLLFSAGCSGDDSDKPDLVLEKDKMVEVMVDVHLAEAVLTRLRGKGEDVTELTEVYYQRVFEMNHITQQEFDTSFTYYQRNLDIMDDIYEDVITELNKMEREAELIQRKEAETDKKKPEEKPEERDDKLDLRMKLKKDIK